MERRPRPPVRPLHSPPLHSQKWTDDTSLMNGIASDQNDGAQKMPSSGSACTPYWRQSIGTSYQDRRHGDPAPTSSGSQHSPQTRNVPGDVDGCTHTKNSLEADFEETNSSSNRRTLGERRNEESTKCEGDGGSTNRDVDGSNDKDLRLLRLKYETYLWRSKYYDSKAKYARLAYEMKVRERHSQDPLDNTRKRGYRTSDFEPVGYPHDELSSTKKPGYYTSKSEPESYPHSAISDTSKSGYCTSKFAPERSNQSPVNNPRYVSPPPPSGHAREHYGEEGALFTLSGKNHAHNSRISNEDSLANVIDFTTYGSVSDEQSIENVDDASDTTLDMAEVKVDLEALEAAVATKYGEVDWDNILDDISSDEEGHELKQ